LIDKKKINATIKYTLPEIELQINSLENILKMRFYGIESLDYLKPYEKLLSDMKKIRDDLLDKYHKAIEDDNTFESGVFETYNGDMSDV
jgi:hypothetical protein